MLTKVQNYKVAVSLSKQPHNLKYMKTLKPMDGLVCGENQMKLFFFIESFIVLCELLMPCQLLLRNAQIVKK